MLQKAQIFYPYRLVASYADGSRLLFEGKTEDEAMEKLEAAQADHGDITWYDGVTDLHYENGKYYELCPHEEIVILVPDRPDDKMS